MKTQLIMLDTPNIVSDEEIKEGDWVIALDTFTIFNCNEYEATKPIKEFKHLYKKIIAGIKGLPSIDWNGLEEEFGWIDVEKLAKSLYLMEEGNWQMNSITSERRRAFEKGFKKAQSINKRKFSLEEARLIWFAGQKYWETSGDSITFEELVERRKELLQPQPKVFDIDIEMESKNDIRRKDNPNFISDALSPDRIKDIPKITNNSIKINPKH